MAQDATGTPTTLGIPKYKTNTDKPTGNGFNAAMDEIDVLIQGRIPAPASPASGECAIWNGTTWVRSSVTGLNISSLAGYPNTGTKVLKGDGTWATLGAIAAATISTPADPAGSSSASEKMMGLAGAITPNTARICIAIQGNYSTAAGGTSVTLTPRYGTGTAPTNAAAATGTIATATTGALFVPNTSSNFTPFSITRIITGLTAGTAYWIDLGLTSDGTHTASIKNVVINSFDLL